VISVPLRELVLTRYEASVTLVQRANRREEGVCIIVFGDNFPQRAVEPEIVIGDQRGEMISISRDQRSIRAYFRHAPPDGAEIVVRYAESQRGVLREKFSRTRIRPLSKDC
jgi:hypothetical protein